MQESIALEVLTCTSEKGFSLDELVYRTRELFEREGLAGFVAYGAPMTSKPPWKPGNWFFLFRASRSEKAELHEIPPSQNIPAG